jgi:hypothetical protein
LIIYARFIFLTAAEGEIKVFMVVKACSLVYNYNTSEDPAASTLNMNMKLADPFK